MIYALEPHLWPYIQIARIDHWFKNVFMLLGVLLALFYEPSLFTWAGVLHVGGALLATCLVASSNYVLNELLDAPRDRFHPVKKHRPVPSGKIQPPWPGSNGFSSARAELVSLCSSIPTSRLWRLPSG